MREEALSGRYIGACNRKAFDTVRHLFIWGAGLTVLFTLVMPREAMLFWHCWTDDRNVITADTYFYWALAIPPGIAAFIWDGIFIGATGGMLPPWQPQPSAFCGTTDSTRF